MSNSLQKRLRALRLLESRLRPDDAWVAHTREILVMQAKNSLSQERVPMARAMAASVRAFFSGRLFPAVRGPVLAVLSVFVVALGGSVASVSAAEQSLPGDFLYSLKLATEQARLALTSGKEEKLKLKVEFTGRRAEELKKVAKTSDGSKSERISQGTEVLKRDLNTLKQQLDDVKNGSEPKAAAEAAKLVDQKTNELVQVLQETKSDQSDDTKKKLVEAQAAAADAGVKAIEILVQKHSESEDVVPKEELVQLIQGHSKAVADATSGSLVATSSSITSATGTDPVPFGEVVEQIKAATQQAFAMEQQQLGNAAGATGTAIGVSVSATGTTGVPVGGSGSSTAPVPTTTSTTAATTTQPTTSDSLLTPP
ncbi:hypothetical protein HY479_00660 [Candidatus Uhrbacteria bacterium]|nr:hypothetical protein [Candidatus Uhrbacteria bacterium]